MNLKIPIIPGIISSVAALHQKLLGGNNNQSAMHKSVVNLLKRNAKVNLSKNQIAKQLNIPANRKGELGGVLSDLKADNKVRVNAKRLYSLSDGKKVAKKAAKKASRNRDRDQDRDSDRNNNRERQPRNRDEDKPRRDDRRQKTEAKPLTGSIKFLPNGHAFFYPIIGDEENEKSGVDFTVHSRIFVPKDQTGKALDGDSVSILPAAPDNNPRRRNNSDDDEIRGRVVEILERRSGRIVGVFRKKVNRTYVETDDNALDGSINITGDTTAEPGQTVVVQLENWDDSNSSPTGRIIEVLGWPGDAGVDILSTIARYGLKTSFPENVLEEARAVPELPSETEIARRRDHRKKLIITIDPADAKDHDDALYIEKTSTGGWLLEVHIADVSHYIKPGAPMDVEAVDRGNSTYLVDRVLPMLPTELSNGICSLKPDVDRLTKCAIIEVSKDGHVTSTKFVDAVIHSRAKLSYEQAQEILDGKPAPEGSDPTLVEAITEAWKMASLLRKNRFANGALDLEMNEIKIKLDENGHASEAVKVIHSSSHRLVEECMLIANQAVAKVLRERSKPSIFRIHEDPDPSRLEDYAEVARQHGYEPGDLTNRSHIQNLLDSSKGSAEEHTIKLGLLKSLKRAAYAADPLGHYGLAKTDYTHFTSPIRRYADLIVHRSLQPFLENPPKPTDRTPNQAELREIARHISDSERTSSEAESETKQIKLLEYLSLIAAEDHGGETKFDGVITDVRGMGLLVEIPDMNVRGAVKREDLPSGSRWRFEEHNKAWTASDGKRLALGMKLPLRIVAIDNVRRFVDFAVAGEPTTEGIQMNNPAPPSKTQGNSRGSGNRSKSRGSGNSRGGNKRAPQKRHRR